MKKIVYCYNPLRTPKDFRYRLQRQCTHRYVYVDSTFARHLGTVSMSSLTVRKNDVKTLCSFWLWIRRDLNSRRNVILEWTCSRRFTDRVLTVPIWRTAYIGYNGFMTNWVLPWNWVPTNCHLMIILSTVYTNYINLKYA